MTYEQMEFDFVKSTPEDTAYYADSGREYTRVCVTVGWCGERVTPEEDVDDMDAAFEFIRRHARRYPGFRPEPWMMTDVPDEKCVVVDFGSHTHFGRVDYV